MATDHILTCLDPYFHMSSDRLIRMIRKINLDENLYGRQKIKLYLFSYDLALYLVFVWLVLR